MSRPPIAGTVAEMVEMLSTESNLWVCPSLNMR